jgi:aminomethyltransferase
MGMFDLSHMGELRVTGRDMIQAVDRLMTNEVATLDIHQARYTPMCYPDGGIVDDLLVYRFQDHIMLVVNASNVDKDVQWIRDHIGDGVDVDNVSDAVALIAVQGPAASAFVQSLTDTDLGYIGYYHFATGTVAGVDSVISRTGYTGEDGFELYVGAEDALRLWQALRRQGEPDGLTLIGLGARDTLRLEAGYMLYGNDIDQTTSPLEAGLGWAVKFLDSDFVGRDALERQKAEGVPRRMMALEMLDRAIPRAHFPIKAGDEQVGELTSGTFSPTFGRGIGLGYVSTDSAKVGADVSIEIRDQPHPAHLVRKPIYKRQGA